MEILTMRQVTRENWRDTLQLTVHPEQQRFIADYAPIAAIALAKAYVRPGGLVWAPYAFYAENTMVGFAELAYEPGSGNNYWICHFFIERDAQGRGYGREALQLLIQFVREQHPNCHTLQLTAHPENIAAQQLYAGAGFQPIGAERDGEPVYELRLRDAEM
ncbi:MAG TPA: GNAT family protein [Ktedonobacterales bacterium]|jgi:diamine N-acetyltransferase|nr:GNAT family protein [Ktedonobacterales bacterium]